VGTNGTNGAAATAFSGIHPGAPILVHDQGERWGAVGCALRGGGATYIVTAGHLFSRGGGGVVRCAASGGAPIEIGAVASNLLDLAPPAGASHPLDAALVRLHAHGEQMLAATTHKHAPRLTGLLDATAIAGTLAQTFRAVSNDYSEVAACTIEPAVVYLPAAARPNRVAVSNVIRTATAVTASGDSGTILCTANDERLALGTCIGIDGAGSLFTPLDAAIDAFSAQIGAALALLL